MLKKLLPTLCFVALVCGHAFSSCTTPQNAIEAENCNTGSSGWIVGSPDTTIVGFATDISFNVGQTVSFKISTSATNYNITIFRIGYYQGNGARQVATVTPSAKLPQTQPACLKDSTTGLVDCGNWALSASWTIPATAVSGLYVADIVRTDTGGANQIFFVVRNDASHSDVIFQTSDESWEAYNGYGGHSLYGPATGFDLTNRANKVSYNRPFAWIESETQPMYAEYPMIRWLEENGYDVTYFSSIDSARSGALIKNHKLYLSVGHDEYVSGPKRASVEAARDAGVNLAFFSGNEFFWKTRWENSIDGTNTPYRTLVCYKETLGSNSNPPATTAVDPQDPPTWTGTWRDPTKSPPADGGRPENALTGQLFRVNGPGSDNTNLSIKVPAAMGKLRFWRNTPNVSTQSAGATWILPASTLGYEWDAEEDNGARPAGLVDLSAATYPLTSDYLQDYGGLYGAGTATHHASLYRAASGVLVFGAGTVQWSFGLDSSSGGTSDINMQQATVNLFADMGVQPATLASGLLAATKSSDVIAPTSQITAPTNGSTVRVGTNVNITGTANDTGGGVVGGVEVSIDGGSTWHPASGLGSWSYSWSPVASGFYTIQSRAVDDSGNLETPSSGITVAASTTAQSLTSLTLSSSSVMAGSSIRGTVTLGQPAASGGVVVTLSSSNSNAATVPTSVTVPSGQFSSDFTVTGLTVTVPTLVTISGTYVSTSSAPVTVKQVLPPAPGSLAIDAFVSKDQGTKSTTVSSPVFSTSASNELILAFVASDSLSPNMTVTGVTGAGLTWNLAVRTNTQLGTAEIWRALAPTSLSSVSVVANLSQSVASSMTILSFAGVDPSGTNGSGAVTVTGTGNSASGAPTASLTTSRNNSMVLGVGVDWDNAISRVVPANQTKLHEYLSPSGDTYWMQMQSAPIPLSGTLATINDTAPTSDRYDLSMVEVRPAPAGSLTISGAITPSTTGSGTQLTLSGAASATVVADSSGNYSFANLANGSYVVTPSKTGVIFNPSSQSVVLNGSSNPAVSFTAASLQSISVTPTNPSVQAGASQAFAATGNYSDGTSQDITNQVSWSSSNTAVATINNSGLASTTAGGSSVITATQGSIAGNTTLTVQATALVISTTSLPGALQNQAYSASVTASGGTAPYSWSLSDSALPTGLSLTSGGQISGIPTVAGTFSFTVRVADSGSPQQIKTQALSIAVTAAPPFYTIWSSSATPVIGDQGPDSSVELGLKFKSDIAGSIKGVRFYKSTANTGSHTGSLWSAAGTLLGSVTFSNETASGWQEADFPTPISISAGTVYVASYHSPVGHYAQDQSYFSSGATDAPPLHALQDGVSGFNGAYIYSPSSAFPNLGFNSTNYWVDVVFVPSASLSSIQVTPASPTITSGATQQFTATGTYSDGSTQNITNQVTWASSNTGVASISSSGLASAVAGGAVSITATQGTVSGNTTLTVQPAPLVITTTSLPGAVQNQAYSAAVIASGGTPPLNWSLANGTVLPAGLSLSSSGQITGTPTASGTSTFTVAVSDSASSPQSTTQALSLNVAANACPCTLGGTITGTGVTGVSLSLSGAGSGVTATDASGSYTFTGLSSGTYTVTPSKSGVTFNPTSQNVTVNGSNVSGVNFTATQTFSISGNISATGANATVTLSGSATGSTTADASGNYTFTGLLNGTYTVTPSKSGVTFNPVSQNVTVNGNNVSGVNFTVAQTFSISGNVSATGANATVALSGSATASTTADASGNYTFTGLINGTYTVTPSKGGATFNPASQNVTVNGGNVSGVNFTASSTTTGLAIDVNVSKDGASASTTIATAAFSTKSSNELLLAFVATDYLSGANTTVSGVAGGGLSWNFVKRTNTQSGDAEIWAALAPSALTNVTVTATVSQSVVTSLTVLSFSGVDTTMGTTLPNAVGATGTGNARTGAPKASLVTTRNNSWVLGVGNDFDNAVARTAGTGQTVVHQYLTPTGDTYWVQMQSATTALSGTTVQINDTAPTGDRYNLTTVEVRTP